MDLKLEGKVALVTGGSRGIGRAIALRLAREGCQVVFSYASNQAAADETLAAIAQAGYTARAMGFDVKDPAACKAAIQDIKAHEGAVSILVNNAGVALDNLLARAKDSDLQTSFETNVFGAFYLAREVTMGMMKARWGRIIMLGSVVGEMGNPGQAIYSGTKAALAGMTRSIAKELGSRNITANLVAPGFIETDMTREQMSEAVKKSLLANVPLQRLGQPEDIADVIAFLCSDAASYITGQVLNVNGGLYV